MLTEDAKVDSSSTRQLLPSSVNISAEYPALPDHDSMNNPSQCELVVTKPHVMHKIRKSCNNPDGKEVVYFQVLTKILQRSYSMNESVRAW